MKLGNIVGVATVSAALLLQGCAGAGFSGMSASPTVNATAPLKASILAYDAADCTAIPGLDDKAAISPIVATFVVSVVANIVRGEVVRRMNAEQEKFSKTYGVRTNVEPRPLQRCIAVLRMDDDQADLKAVFRVVELPEYQAITLQPVQVQLDKAVARARGRDQKFTLTITLSAMGVTVSDDGPQTTSYFTQAFTITDLTLGVAATPDQLGTPSQYLPRPADNRPLTLAASITERGSGSEFYRDIATALSANEDAIQALIDGAFAKD